MSTVHDVARLAGVSIATVSRVFGRPDAVATATRQRVLSAADELGYAPNTSARALVRGRTGYLGLLVHDLANPFYATIVKAAQLEARCRGLALFCADYGDRPAEELALAKEMARHVDGLLLYPSQPADDPLRAAVADLGPTVLVDSPVDGVPHVVMSTAEGVGQAVDHLTALGHRGLTYLDASPTAMFTSLDRRRNVEASCARAGLALSVIGPFSPSFESGVRAADLVIAEGSTAVLAFSDQMALGVVRRLTERGVRVGADISVVGVDDIWIAAQVTPALTTVRMPCADAGAAATRLLIDGIDGGATTSRVVLPTELIVRSSTGPVPTPWRNHMTSTTQTSTRRPLGVAIAGFGWMGRVHTQAYARVLHHFPQLAVAPQLVAVADEVPGRAEEAADQFGFTKPTRDWREVAADPDVAAVSIAAPNFLHREIGVAMARAGKHIWIEKPVGLTADDARAVADAVKQAGVMGAVGFNYRNAPAVATAKEMVESGELGTVTHVRFRLFSDYAAHPEGALSWRFERERGGSGVLGDLAAHGVDLARYLLGEIDALTADTAIFLAERARPTGATAGHQRATGGELGPVENEDYVTSLVRFASGARGVLEASRIAVGEQNNYGFEIHGTKGAVFWDFRRMNELGVSTGDAYQDQAVTTLYVGPTHGFYGAFQPGSATSMGYDDLKVIEAYNFLRSIADGTPHGTTLDDAVRSAEALDAMAESARTGTWVSLPR